MALPPHYLDRLRYLREKANEIYKYVEDAKHDLPVYRHQRDAAKATFDRLDRVIRNLELDMPTHERQLQQAVAEMRAEERRVQEMERKEREQRDQAERERARQASDQIYQQGIDRGRRGGLFG